MSNAPTSSAFLEEDPCEDLKRSHELDRSAHLQIYSELIQNAGSESERIRAIIQVREAEEAGIIDVGAIQISPKKNETPSIGEEERVMSE